MGNILVIVDMQKGFINSRTKELPKKIRNHVDDSASFYDKIIFTKFINYGNMNYINRLGYRGMTDSPDIDIVDELEQIELRSTVINKNTYSALKNEQLRKEVLESNSKLYICGVDTDACILATAFEAFDLGIEFEILLNLVGTSASNPSMDVLGLLHRNIGSNNK